MPSATLLLASAELPTGEDRWTGPFEQPSYAESGGRGRVLVVDDDPTVRSLIARILEEAGYQVETAPDALSALRAVSSVQRDFDLVITDVRMPTMDGWELGRRLQRDRPMMPVLYVSGYDVAGSAPSPMTFLRKPFEVPELLGRVDRLLGEA